MNIQSTQKYWQFKILIDNRDTSRQHINRLKDAMRNKSEILKNQPILVNENMEIIDGQHRFYAASELGVDIYYTVVKGLTIEDARHMNILQRRWTFDDFARSHAKAGNVNYQKFLEYQKKYPFLKNNSLVIYMLGYQQHAFQTKFRSGEFVIETDEEVLRDWLDKATLVASTIQVPFSTPLAMALLEMLQNEGFDFNKFYKNLEKKPELITRGRLKKEYLREIEDVYNFNARTIVRLF